MEIAKTYEAAGANAISCLTEEHYFQGSSEYLAAIRKAVSLPILRKDFIFDEYQVYEAAAIGADAAPADRRSPAAGASGGTVPPGVFAGAGSSGGGTRPEELESVAFLQPQILGVNNRNLKTFEVNLDTVAKLRPYAPENAVFVSESGIRNHADMQMVRQLGADAVLIGETLMRSGNVTETLHQLREGI